MKYLLIIPILILMSSCGAGWYKHPSYEFETDMPKDNGKYLISEIKKFKLEHPIYEVYKRDSTGNCKSMDSYGYNGAYDTYTTNIYLPQNRCFASLTLIAPKDGVRSLSFTLYLMTYTEPKENNCIVNICDAEWGKHHIIWKDEKSPKQESVERELDEIMLQIGKYKKE